MVNVRQLLTTCMGLCCSLAVVGEYLMVPFCAVFFPHEMSWMRSGT